MSERGRDIYPGPRIQLCTKYITKVAKTAKMFLIISNLLTIYKNVALFSYTFSFRQFIKMLT